MDKACGSCGVMKPLDHFYKTKKHNVCISCRRDTGTRARRKVKLELVKRYGGCCYCCGESRIEFLTIDHINGGGSKHRKSLKVGGSFYYWLRREGYPKGYRLLCYNCNCSLGHLGYCPHATPRYWISNKESK